MKRDTIGDYCGYAAAAVLTAGAYLWLNRLGEGAVRALLDFYKTVVELFFGGDLYYNADAGGIVDIPALRRSLDIRYAGTYSTRLYRSKLRMNYSYNNIPLISGAYKRYIYGGRELSWECFSRLDALFMDGIYYNMDFGYDPANLEILDLYAHNKNLVEIMDLRQETRYDDSIGAYRTSIGLALKNQWDDKNEYKLQFTLPDGGRNMAEPDLALLAGLGLLAALLLRSRIRRAGR